MAAGLRRRGLLLAALPLAGRSGPALAELANLAADGRTLTWPGRPGAIILPAWTPRTMAVSPVGSETLTSLALTDMAPDSALEVMLLAAHDGRAPRILALEVLQWQSPLGRLNTRTSIDPSRNLLILDRNAAARRGSRFEREAWRDFLVWQDDALVDQPVRAAPAGSLQAGLGVIRHKAQAWLATPRVAVTTEDLVRLGLDARGFTLV